MRVLNVNMTIDPINGGGTAERTFQMSRFQAKIGVECTLLTTDKGLTIKRKAELEGVNLIILPCFNERFYIPKVNLKKIESLVESADIIHLMSHWTLLNAMVYICAQRLNKPYVICPAGELLSYGRSKLVKRFFSKIIGDQIIRNSSGYIAITANEIPQFEARGVTADSVTVIPNGINPEEFIAEDIALFRNKYGLGDSPYILFVGRLSPIKGPDLLLKAFQQVQAEIDALHLVFVGPDQGMRDSLEEYARSNGLSGRTHFIGYLGGADKAQAYYGAELLVIPSRHEAMSIVALEAGITGTPVLLTNQCGFDELADIDGGMVVPATVEGLSQGLKQILSNSSRLREMGANLRRHVVANYTWDSVVSQFTRLYESIIIRRMG